MNPPRLLNARSPELSRLGVRVPAIFVSPSVPANSVLRRDGLRCPVEIVVLFFLLCLLSDFVPQKSGFFPSQNAPGKVFSHASLSATFHDWFGTEVRMVYRDFFHF